jgi:hypothetical protein
LLAAQNLAERLEDVRHLWQNQGTKEAIDVCICKAQAIQDSPLRSWASVVSRPCIGDAGLDHEHGDCRDVK